jgi:hypothetical protein
LRIAELRQTRIAPQLRSSLTAGKTVRNNLMVAALGVLAACGASNVPNAEDRPQADGPASAARKAADRSAAEMAGTYEVVSEDGTVVLQTVAADGTYFETIDGSETERGTWHQKGDRMCFDPDGDRFEQCYTGGPADSNGSFSVEMDGGTASVRRMDETDDAEPTGVPAARR